MIFDHILEENEDKSISLISNIENKALYGEVYTPISFVKDILSIIPETIFQNPYLRWLDPGAGTGNFSLVLYYKLLNSLEYIISDINERRTHIIKNMIYMVELRPENIIILKTIFGEDANIYEGNFLTFNNLSNSCDIKHSTWPIQFDMIIGNPPFNLNGSKKVPTNNKLEKKQDGLTVWMSFIIKSISLLHDKTGKLCVFIPY